MERGGYFMMSSEKSSKFGRFRAVFAGFLLLIGMASGVVGGVVEVPGAYAITADDGQVVDDDTNEQENTEGTEATNDVSTETQDAETEEQSGDGCKDSLGALGWLVCPATGAIAKAVDWLYEKIEDFLVVKPIAAEDGTPVYEIWKYCLGFANIAFIIFLLIVVYSQITGVGISNYGVKKVLPKLIVMAIMVNLSFLICLLAIDVSNILGNSVRGLFKAVEESTLQVSTMEGRAVSYASMYSALAGGTALTVAGGVIAFELGAIWMLIPTVLGAIVAVATGLITIALRQAVVVLLVMVSPLALVASVLPNTEQWYKKWKDLLTKMLVFYPMFSLLFGASSLAGFAIIMSAKDGFGLMLGTAVQIFPLFFSWKLMQMSGTLLGGINMKLRGLAARPLMANRAWAGSHMMNTRMKRLASERPATPSLRLMQFMANRRVERDMDTHDNMETVKNRGMEYRVRRYYDKTGKMPSRRGEQAYARQAQNLGYQNTIMRNTHTMNKGLSYMAAEGTADKVRLGKLDAKMIDAAVTMKTEQARGEKIEYDNAKVVHERMEAVINAHMDDVHGFEFDKDGNKKKRKDYKFHLDPNSSEHNAALAQYNAMRQIMEGSAEDVQFAVAGAAQGYDTQKKIVETRMQKYFDMTVPTKDIEHRLSELTKLSPEKLKSGVKATDNMDMILPGLRVLNQRGDTNLVQEQMENILSQDVGGGIKLGSHAAQSLASFLMFEVKDSDPFQRRFGKYINLETARVFNSNDRQEMNITYDEYVRGYHDEPDGTRMYAKKGMRQLVEGTSLDNIERTALSNLDDSLKRTYGFDERGKGEKWDVAGYLKKREEIQTAFEPAFLSASLKWMSGSEQINSGVKFWTGYELKQKKDEHGKLVLDKNGDPEYDLTPVWKSEEFAGHEEEVEKYYRRKTGDYFKDQTTGQVLSMRSDYRDATMEHMLAEYLDKNPDEKKKYDDGVAEIQTRYADKSIDEAEKLRAKDVKSLKMELAGRQVRKILGETGKLKQIHRLKRSGVTNNAKDWLRKWVNLDNEEALRKEVEYYDELQRKAWEEEMRKRKEADPSFEYEPTVRVYDESKQSEFLARMSKINDDYRDGDTRTFFNETRAQLDEWFPDDYIVWAYEKYFKNNPYATNDDLYSWLKDTLEDLDNYPGNRDRK